MRKIVFLGMCTSLAMLAASPLSAADPLIAGIAGMTCKGFFAAKGSNARETQGAIWMVVAADGSVHYWRKWGREAVANYKPAQRDSEYEDKGSVNMAVSGGKIFWSNTSMGTIFNWELTPAQARGSFVLKVTGGKIGTEGVLECT